MVSKKVFLALTLTTILVESATLPEVEEFYCKKEEGSYEICRRCPDLTENCEQPDTCQCQNIATFNTVTKAFQGGSDCKSDKNGNWCYISSSSPCNDKKKSNRASLIDGIWYKNDIYFSYTACLPENQHNFDTGNEIVMEGVKIIEDNLGGSNGTDDITSLSIFHIEYKDCKKECEDRCGFCGGWSYDDINGLCYLHTVNSCCGQKMKREKRSNWTSGYVCPKCWSTHNECPCDLTSRLRGPLTCQSGVSQSAAGKPQYETSAGLLGVITIDSPQDPCACQNRLFKRRGKETCRCVKTQCKDEFLNPEGTCTDKRRCRANALPESKFKFC